MQKAGFFLLMLLFTACRAEGQRSYRPGSVLATGNWYSIAVTGPGVYKVDIPLLNKLGVNTNNLSSSTIRLFGNGGAMLPEACSGFKQDDLLENALQIKDGGDGIFNGNDYFLFYASGPATWLKDSLNQRFQHQQNLYASQSVYFITTGGTGKRISAQGSVPAPNTTVTSFSERWFHELDSVNLLSSSKDWYGEELSTLQGHSSTQAFSIPLSNIITAQPATLISSCIARSLGSSSRFTVSVNGQAVLQQDVDPVGGTNLDLFGKSVRSAASFSPGSKLSIGYAFTPGGVDAEGWIDWLEVFCRSNLAMTGTEQLPFRDWKSVAPGNTASFVVQNAANAQVWDVTAMGAPQLMAAKINGNDLSFVNDAASLHEYIAFSTSFLTPVALGKIANQDLHRAEQADLIIVTYPAFLQQAQRIAAFHEQYDHLKTIAVTTSQVFNEFSSGIADPSAIRDFVKMYYDRAAGDPGKRPRYLLLLGDASYDYKNRVKNNTNFVPAYENNFSLDPLSTYTSDDFFGLLDDNEDINSGQVTNLLDIGIGRIPAQTNDQATAYVDKLFAYRDPKSLGPWRNQQTFIADDQDQNLHLNDAEQITAAAQTVNPLFLQNKIYLDAFTQTSTPAGSRYPEVNQAINQQVQNGTLILNYNGHGSASRLAEEVIIEKNVVDSWTNDYRLPLLITATCDFAPYDNPAVNSLGEDMLLRNRTGAIALMTTTRLVFAFSNRIMNRNYLQAALQPAADGSYLSLGEAVRQAKNFTYQTQADLTNNRKFQLLGDPALTLSFPRYHVETLSINGKTVGSIPDTLKALQQYNITGNIQDAAGMVQSGFNGTVYATVFDKTQTVTTLANDADSYQQGFQVLHNKIFKGSATVVNGVFSLQFIVPKDINYQPGSGTISYYADNGQVDGNGYFTRFLVGGSEAPGITDDKGPLIKAYLNNENFLDGGVVNAKPLLLLQLEDASGINIIGTGIGHDITATVDGDSKQVYILNDFFETKADSYQQGTVRFQLPELTPGMHTIIIKAWDVANNSSTLTLRCRVEIEAFKITRLFNYPNPFAGHTSFHIEQNRPGIEINATIQIFTTASKLLKTITATINTNGSRSSDIDWDGRSDHEGLLPPGIYIYRVQLSAAADGETAVQSGKLIRL